MPTNVTPEYKKAEAAFREATTIEEKIDRLELMIALLPKHKGTDHLYANLKQRLSKLRKQLETSGKKGRGGLHRGGPYADITREGAAQLVMIGPANCGKSSILEALTNAKPEIGDYPFTTHQLQPGMIEYEDIQIQLIDSPPVTADFMPEHLQSFVRGADAVLLVADLSKDSILEDTEIVIEAFASRHVDFVPDPQSKDLFSVACRILANKKDTHDADSRLEMLHELMGQRFDIFAISCLDTGNVTELPAMLFRWLNIVRVYTKTPGKKADLKRPYTVFAGHTVEDVCGLIHKDFRENLRFARLWRNNRGPITISRNENVQDGDILEIHT